MGITLNEIQHLDIHQPVISIWKAQQARRDKMETWDVMRTEVLLSCIASRQGIIHQSLKVPVKDHSSGGESGLDLI
jgi:hypothetical protein